MDPGTIPTTEFSKEYRMAREALLTAAGRFSLPATMVVALASLAFAKDTLIDAQAPYACGVIAAPAPIDGDERDTVLFSTGAGLTYVQLCGPMCDEYSCEATGFLGLAYGASGTRSPTGIPSPDTAWFGGSFSFPDSLVATDTAGPLGWSSSWGCAFGMPVKEWTCYSINCGMTGCVRWASDWHCLTYAHCPNGSHMAFQFAVDTTFVGGNWNGWVVRWAVDSAGNGVFKVGATGIPEVHGSRAAPKAGRAPQWTAMSRRADATYDILGRCRGPGLSPRAAGLVVERSAGWAFPGPRIRLRTRGMQ